MDIAAPTGDPHIGAQKGDAMADDGRFDIVVVGAGPAGCVLARRLTEDPGADGRPPGGGSRLRTRPDRLAGGVAGSGRHLPRLAPLGLPPRRPPRRPPPPAAPRPGRRRQLDDQRLRLAAGLRRRLRRLGGPGQPRLVLCRPAAVLPAGGGGPARRSLSTASTARCRCFRATEADLTRSTGPSSPPPSRSASPGVADLNGDPAQHPGVGPTPKNVAGGVRMHAAFTYLAPARTPAQPHPHPRRARRPRLRRGRPGDGRAHRRRAGGARAAGRPLRRGLRLAGHPAPLRHRAGGGPAGSSASPSSPTGRASARICWTTRASSSPTGTISPPMSVKPEYAPAARIGGPDAAQGAQPTRRRGDRPLRRPRPIPRRGTGSAGSPSSGSIWRWLARRVGCA